MTLYSYFIDNDEGPIHKQWHRLHMEEYFQLSARADSGLRVTGEFCLQMFFLCKWGIPCLFFIYFSLFKQTFQFYNENKFENVHPVYGAGILTHDLWNTSLPTITTRPVYQSFSTSKRTTV